MNEATRWRRELAERMAALYAVQPKVAAVALAGSVARGWADRHSDIELDVYWAEPPTEADRQAPITNAGGQIDIFWENPPTEDEYKEIFERTDGRISQLWPYEDDEWSEHYYIESVSIGVSGFLTKTIEGYLDDVLEKHKADDERQIRLAAIKHAVPLHGAPLLIEWQARSASYPHELVVALINEQLAEDDKWWSVDMWVERESYLALIDLLHHMQIKTLRVLLALNHIYLPDPRFKWTDKIIPQMDIHPPDLDAHLNEVFTLQPIEGAAATNKIFYETLELVEQHVPEIDVTFYRGWYSHRRPVNVR